ncbi:MAG TPA: four-carbon acid sugar kinase family protein [Symbiobacteriaceae bacterium]|nr:four-carbon acid sugar kinase family protein [Symbiobacteriaceae bacterium]
MARIAIIADDLTGASDTGVQFARKGLRTRVLFGAEAVDGAGATAVVIDTDSRAIQPGEARERVRRAACQVREAGFEHVFKKIDSTLRGNLGQEIDGILSELKVDLAVVAPAFPKLGRTTVGGRHLLRGLPLEETEIARDPKCPVRESQIERLLASQASRRTGRVDLSVVRDGSAALLAALEGLVAAGVEVAVIDAEVDADLQCIAWTVAHSGRRVLWVGSAGLADFLPEALELGVQPFQEPCLGESGRPVMLVAGSISPTTREQALLVSQQPGFTTVELDPLAVLGSDPESEFSRCAAQLEGALAAGRDLVLVSGSAPEQVAAAQALGTSRGLSPTAVSDTIAAGMGEVAARIIRHHRLDGAVLTGGDTAKAVCRRLGATGLEVLKELEPGVPLSRLTGGAELLAVTKAGAFGTPMTLLRALYALKGAELKP